MQGMVPKSAGQSRSTGQDRTTQLLHGVLDMCLMSIIDEEASYGYEMVRKLRDRGLDLASEGSIYPLLSRLQKQGMIEGYLVQSSEGPARKYYRMSKPGQHALDQWRDDWAGFKASVDEVLNGGPHDR
jgi:PadR family transcriptional regulator PadR